MGTIIIHDNDAAILDILTIALQMEDIEVYPLPDNSSIIELIEQVKPDLVMLDYMLDGKDCLLKCEQIKAIYPQLPVIVLSCNSTIDNNYQQYGFDDFIPKPFELEQLYGVLDKYIDPINSLVKK